MVGHPEDKPNGFGLIVLTIGAFLGFLIGIFIGWVIWG